MTVTITRLTDDATTSPMMIQLPYQITDESRNIEDDLLNGDMAIALIAPRPGTGELTLLYDNETDARAGRSLHRVASAFALVDTDNPAANITYVLGPRGQTLSIDEDTQEMWALVVSYREVDL